MRQIICRRNDENNKVEKNRFFFRAHVDINWISSQFRHDKIDILNDMDKCVLNLLDKKENFDLIEEKPDFSFTVFIDRIDAIWKCYTFLYVCVSRINVKLDGERKKNNSLEM